jgi:ribosomal protein S6--L-glutamate ligase
MRFLILSTARNCIAAKRLTKEALERGHKVAVLDPSKLFLLISNIEQGYDRIFYVDGAKVTRINIKDYDAIIPRIGDNVGYGAFIVEHLNRNLGIFSTASAEGIRIASNQLMTLQKLSSYGLPTPRTVFAQNPNHIPYLIEKVGGYPIVVKLLHGSGGSGVTLLKDKSSAIPTLQSLFKSRSSVLVQEYLDSGGTDYRVIVAGSQVITAFKRSAKKGDFRANLKLGGFGAPVNLSTQEKDLCIHAARAISLQIVGVDIIQSAGKTYVIEANANFGYTVESITGFNVAKQTIRFCEQNYRTRIHETDRTSAVQGLLLEERLKSESMIKQFHALKKEMGLLTEDQYIQDLFSRARGKTITYRDRNQKRRQVTVTSLQDIFQIMKESFVVN